MIFFAKKISTNGKISDITSFSCGVTNVTTGAGDMTLTPLLFFCSVSQLGAECDLLLYWEKNPPSFYHHNRIGI